MLKLTTALIIGRDYFGFFTLLSILRPTLLSRRLCGAWFSLLLRLLGRGLCRWFTGRADQPTDLHHLNAHLRQDAGLDEMDIERGKVLRSPLIR